MLKKPVKTRFNPEYWEEVITRPDWYVEFVAFAKKLEKDLASEPEEIKTIRIQYRKYFAEKLRQNKANLAENGPDLDVRRLPIDTIVIHHTSSPPGYNLDYMNAVHLLNIYAPYYTNPTVREERGIAGKPLWSGHFRDEKQTFLAYHWFLRSNTEFERLLGDDKIGWHAGNWDINRRSIGICIDNDYEMLCPTNETLQALAEHIKTNYPEVSPERVIGHCEASSKTTCPGTHFLEEWKAKLLEYF